MKTSLDVHGRHQGHKTFTYKNRNMDDIALVNFSLNIHLFSYGILTIPHCIDTAPEEDIYDSISIQN